MASRRRARCWASRLGAQRGQVLVVLVLVVPMMLGISAIVVDVGRIFVERRSLQQAADAAALAAAQRLPGQPAMRHARAPSPHRRRVQGEQPRRRGGPALPACDAVTTSNCYRILGPAASPDRVEVIVTENVPTLFGGIFGKKSFDVKARAVAARFAHTEVQPGRSSRRSSESTNPDSVSVSTVTTPGRAGPGAHVRQVEACTRSTSRAPTALRWGGRQQRRHRRPFERSAATHSSGATPSPRGLTVNNPLWGSISRQSLPPIPGASHRCAHRHATRRTPPQETGHAGGRRPVHGRTLGELDDQLGSRPRPLLRVGLRRRTDQHHQRRHRRAHDQLEGRRHLRHEPHPGLRRARSVRLRRHPGTNERDTVSVAVGRADVHGSTRKRRI